MWILTRYGRVEDKKSGFTCNDFVAIASLQWPTSIGIVAIVFASPVRLSLRTKEPFFLMTGNIEKYGKYRLRSPWKCSISCKNFFKTVTGQKRAVIACVMVFLMTRVSLFVPGIIPNRNIRLTKSCSFLLWQKSGVLMLKSPAYKNLFLSVFVARRFFR